MADKIGVDIPGSDTTARSMKKYFIYTERTVALRSA